MPKSPIHLSVKKHNNSVPQILLQSLTHILKCIPSSHETKKINTSQNTGTIITSMPSDHQLNFIVKERKAAVQSSVKQLHFGGWKEKKAAAEEIKRLAGEGLGTRRLLAELGVITSLVCMLVESHDDQLRCLAIDTLIELANGTFRNKALIAEAGLLDKLPNINKTQDSNLKLKLATLLLSISSLTKTHFSITPQNILPFLTNILITIPSNLDQDLKLKCLATLYNLSTKLETLNLIASSVALVHALISLSLDQQTSKLALATLANLVLCSRGKKTIEDEESMVPQVFMEIMAWEEKPKCQELVMYILMMLANGSFAQRMKMRELGIVPLLLEVALLGNSSLAQKRALKMMEWFKDERHAKMGVHSGPQDQNRFLISGRSPEKGGGRQEECRRAVRRMVRQSLDQNMEMITRRGNGSQACSLIKSLVVTRSSKSLPY